LFSALATADEIVFLISFEILLSEKDKSLIYIGGLSNRNLSGLSKELPQFIGFLNN